MRFGNRAYVQQIVPSDLPRFVVGNTDDTFWTGNGWCTELMAALLYCNQEQATAEADSMNRRIRRRSFTATVRIAVECKEEFSLDELRATLGFMPRSLWIALK